MILCRFLHRIHIVETLGPCSRIEIQLAFMSGTISATIYTRITGTYAACPRGAY